jgi:hypothetical protein
LFVDPSSCVVAIDASRGDGAIDGRGKVRDPFEGRERTPHRQLLDPVEHVTAEALQQRPQASAHVGLLR